MVNDGTIHSTFNEGHIKVEGETAYCVDINTGFKNGYKTRHDASASMSAAQIEDVALLLEYVRQYRSSHSNLNANEIITNGNAMYFIEGATFGIFSEPNCSNQIGTLTTNEKEVIVGTVYIKELFATKGYKIDT